MPSLPIRADHLSYAHRLEPRALDSVDLLVVHCTELPDLATARGFGERLVHSRSQTGNCGHYYIERKGSIEEWVAPNRIAHHVRGYNERSLGVELVNRGRFPDWFDSRRQLMAEPYSAAQISALLRLIEVLRVDLPELRWIAGHEDLDTDVVPASDNRKLQVRRKRDPGPLFPWAEVLAATPLTRLLMPAPGPDRTY